jgi:hypothetical protein
MDLIDNTTVGSRINEMEWWTIDVTKVGRKLLMPDRPVILEHGLAPRTLTFCYQPRGHRPRRLS